MKITKMFSNSMLALTGLLSAGAASAQTALADLPFVGVPVDGGTGFQRAVTDNARQVQWLDGFLLVIITIITLFVTGLLAYVCLRYNSKANPEPATFTHNSPLEIAWTVVPVVILVVIGAYSLPVLYHQQEIPEGEVTIKVTGHQWNWSYEYRDEGIEFFSYMLEEDELEEYGYLPEHYRLATDTSVVVPLGADIVMQVTGADVIHSWKIPAFGVMQDGVPGRLTDLWFNADVEGVYFGQCSELCGRDHAFMPIVVRVVDPVIYAQWVEEMGGNSTAYIDSIGTTEVETAAIVAE